MIINCTPQEGARYNTTDCYMYNGTLYLREGDEEYPEPLRVYPAAKELTRVIFKQKLDGVVDGILIYRWAPDGIVNFPGLKPDTYYIVSKMVAQAWPEREDFILPGTLVRNKSGDVVGCIDFSRV